MNLVIFGLTVSSSWGNGHATLWRGLLRSLARCGCRVTFFERDTPYYAMNRDLYEIAEGELVFFTEWAEVAPMAARAIRTADAVIVTSYCPCGVEATELAIEAARGLRVFYDLDTPVTLSRLSRGEPISYIGPRGLGGFDLVLSYTGGAALTALTERLGAKYVVPLYGHVDPEIHHPVEAAARFAADLSYLGTFAADRQSALETLFVEPARQRPTRRFVIGGAQYPPEFPWAPNIYFVRHLPPAQHPAFFSSSRMTLNVTREAMAATGWCPSGRLFEAAACGAPLLSDSWPGLEDFFEPGRDICVARSASDVAAALDLTDAELRNMAENARERVLAEHTSERRAEELLALLSQSASRVGRRAAIEA